MEFGPRALGARSILGDPRNPEMQKRMNLRIKYRESFRPFAPAVLESKVQDWFELEGTSPYMLVVAEVAGRHRTPDPEEIGTGGDFHKRLAASRSGLPAVTHLDNSARIQTVDRDRHGRFHRLLERFHKATGCPVLVNTSFNVRGEPLVCTPEDAIRCFLATEMDLLVVGDFILRKTEQPESAIQDHAGHVAGFKLD